MRADEMPIGLDANYLIDPEVISARHWGFYALDDNLDFDQLRLLLPTGSLIPESVHGVFPTKFGNEMSSLVFDAPMIGQFMFELSGDHVAVFDMPPTFILSVLYGDISLVATSRSTLIAMFGTDEMSHDDWRSILDPTMPELANKIRSKYNIEV